MIIRIFNKCIRELYRFFHPRLWGKAMQINGLPRIYDIRHLSIGSNVAINAGCVLQCYGGVKIGNNVTISDGAKILSRSLDISDYKHNAEKAERDHIDKTVVIEDGVWICANAIVLPGVSIARNVIVASGAVVTKTLYKENTVYGGIPAIEIRHLEAK